MTDLKSPFLIHLKGWLFLAILATSSILIFIQLPTWRVGLLLAFTIWSSARFYYYLFYVIENYVDSGYKFAGVLSAVQYLLNNRRRKTPSDDE